MRTSATQWLRGAATVSLLATAAVGSGCSTMSNTEKGALVGGGAGAGIGALVGNAAGHHAGLGAVVGGLGGATLGALAGNSADQAEKKDLQGQLAVAQAQAARGPLSVQEVGQMAQQGQSDAVIINQIRTTGSVYNLSASDIGWLKGQGVSDAVLIEMQNSGRRPRPVVVAPPPPPPTVIVREPAPVYIYERPPPPPMGFGVSYIKVH